MSQPEQTSLKGVFNSIGLSPFPLGFAFLRFITLAKNKAMCNSTHSCLRFSPVNQTRMF